VGPYSPPASGRGGKWEIDNGGATSAHWCAHNGHDAFAADEPRVWVPKLGGTIVEVALDDKRVAVVTPVESASAPQRDHEIVMLLNFFDAVRHRVPKGK
jgi:hypothetical protein